MTGINPATRSIVVERIMPHPPEKIWRALTEPALIAAQRRRAPAFWGSKRCLT